MGLYEKIFKKPRENIVPDGFFEMLEMIVFEVARKIAGRNERVV